MSPYVTPEAEALPPKLTHWDATTIPRSAYLDCAECQGRNDCDDCDNTGRAACSSCYLPGALAGDALEQCPACWATTDAETAWAVAMDEHVERCVERRLSRLNHRDHRSPAVVSQKQRADELLGLVLDMSGDLWRAREAMERNRPAQAAHYMALALKLVQR